MNDKPIDPHNYSPVKVGLPATKYKCRICGLGQKMCELTYKPRETTMSANSRSCPTCHSIAITSDTCENPWHTGFGDKEPEDVYHPRNDISDRFYPR